MSLSESSQSRRDIAHIVLAGTVAFAIVTWLDVNERMVEWGQVHHHPQFEWIGVEDIPTAVALMALGLGWYAFRRWRQAKAEAYRLRRERAAISLDSTTGRGFRSVVERAAQTAKMADPAKRETIETLLKDLQNKLGK